MELAPPGSSATMTLVTWFPQMAPGSLQGLVFDTDDLAAAAADLQTRGVAIGPIEADPWGQYAGFTDPDGNGLVLRQKAPAA